MNSAPGSPAHGEDAVRRRRGEMAHQSGLAAEDQVSARYVRGGHTLAASRWRGSCGEIDLVMRKGDEVVFVEVKKARSLDEAAFRLAPRQMERLHAAASEFLAAEPLGLNTPARFDLALVGGQGEIEIVENITMG